MLERINSALTKHNVCSIASSELISLIDVTTSQGNIEHLATEKVAITLIDEDSGEQLIITGIGLGQDNGDRKSKPLLSSMLIYCLWLYLQAMTQKLIAGLVK